MSTKLSTANLATRRTHQRTDPRLQLRRLRVAFVGIVSAARRMPAPFYELTRTRERAYPFEAERCYVHAAIREGATTPEKVVAWRMAQLHDDLAQFDEAPQLEDLVYVQLINEESEAVHAQTIAYAFPTPANREAALRETAEAVSFCHAFMQMVRAGGNMLRLSH